MKKTIFGPGGLYEDIKSLQKQVKLLQKYITFLIFGAVCLAVASILTSIAVFGKELLPGPYQAEVISVYDGDTFTVQLQPGYGLNVNIWPGLQYRLRLEDIQVTTAIRVRGIDTPERRGSCKEEKVKANVARAFVKRLVKDGVTLSNVELGKYAGRVIADVTLPGGRSLTEELMNAGLGRPYDGGKRESWCNE